MTDDECDHEHAANHQHRADIQYPIVHAPSCGRRDELHPHLGAEFVEQVVQHRLLFREQIGGAAAAMHPLRQLSDDPVDLVAQRLADA